MYYCFNIVNGIFGLSLCTVAFLKLYSYIHFWYDVRIFIKNKSRLIKTDSLSVSLQHDMYVEIEDVITNYPKNLTLSNLFLFLAMPVLCYQFKYPRTERIRKTNVINYLLQFILCITLLV
jgi:diacylglycerol O-acyltransferase-1